jgi:hypothetical protein
MLHGMVLGQPVTLDERRQILEMHVGDAERSK